MPKKALFASVREAATAFVRGIEQMIRRSLRKSVGDNTEQWIEEFDHLSGSGHSDGWRFDRNEIHER